MIRIDLTQQESQLLLHWLENKTPSDLESSLQQKMVAACRQALTQLTCPVCEQPFDQLKKGRTGLYCSNACRQKAYRQRRYDHLRQSYPPSRP